MRKDNRESICSQRNKSKTAIRGVRTFIIIGVLMLSLLKVKTTAAASTFVLSGDASGSFSELSDAVTAANAAPGAYVITASGDDYDLTATQVISDGVEILLETDSAASALTVSIASGRHFTVNGSLMLKNIILNGMNTGGGVTVTSGAYLEMDSGSVIRECRASRGGGIYVNAGGELVMRSDASVDACQSTYTSTGGSGGGIYLEGKFTLDDEASVTNCTANGGKGGGVAVCLGTAEFTMNGGRISGNRVLGASSDFMAGGVLVYDRDEPGSSTFIMNGGEISENEAAVGGGVSVSMGAAQFIMNDGKITGNKAILSTGVSGYGGGIYVMSWGGIANVKMNGGEIFGNEANHGGGIFTADGPILEIGGVIRDNTAVYAGGLFCQAFITMFGDGAITGNTATSAGGLYLYSGNFVMNGNSVISGNRATWTGGAYVRNSTSMTMNDNAAITGNIADDNGGGVWIRETAVMTMNGGTISENSALKTNANSDAYGGGVLLGYPNNPCEPKFTVNAGSIIGNYAESYGGGIAAFYGTVTIDGGSVVNNVSESDGGGIYVAETGTVNITGAAITGNTAAGAGGGIFTENYEYADPLTDPDKYQNISTTDETVFSENTAIAPFNPPSNPEFLPNIKAASVSIDTRIDHPLNNYDINYEGSPYTGTYTVIYNANGGSGTEHQVAAEVGTAHTVLSVADVGYTRTGYTFLGWSTDSTAANAQYAAGDLIGETASAGDVITLYAIWQANPPPPPVSLPPVSPSEPPVSPSEPPVSPSEPPVSEPPASPSEPPVSPSALPTASPGGDVELGDDDIPLGEGEDIPDENPPLSGEVPETGDAAGNTSELFVFTCIVLACAGLVVLTALLRRRKT